MSGHTPARQTAQEIKHEPLGLFEAAFFLVEQCCRPLGQIGDFAVRTHAFLVVLQRTRIRTIHPDRSTSLKHAVKLIRLSRDSFLRLDYRAGVYSLYRSSFSNICRMLFGYTGAIHWCWRNERSRAPSTVRSRRLLLLLLVSLWH